MLNVSKLNILKKFPSQPIFSFNTIMEIGKIHPQN